MTESDSSSASTLVKTDSLGRLRASPERREMLLREFERSGMSGPEFAAMIGVKYQTFAGWRQRRASGRRSRSACSVLTSPRFRLFEHGGSQDISIKADGQGLQSKPEAKRALTVRREMARSTTVHRPETKPLELNHPQVGEGRCREEN